MVRIDVQEIDVGKLRLNLHTDGSRSSVLKAYRALKLTELQPYVDELAKFIPTDYLQNGPDETLLERLKVKGQTLFQLLFGELGSDIRKLADSDNPEHLQIIIDEEIAFLPFDFLFTGDMFLWEGFFISRQISTKHSPSHRENSKSSGTRFTLVGNPTDDPELEPSIRAELYSLSKKLNHLFDLSGPHFGKELNSQAFTELLSNCDYFHFSGHFKSQSQTGSGWSLADDVIFSAEHIKDLQQIPHFIFANTCGDLQSISEGGFIRSFLDTGVQAYVTTMGEIPSDKAQYFSLHFYKKLVAGFNFGQALFFARKAFIQRFGFSDLSWMFYILYGDATQKLKFDVKKKKKIDLLRYLVIISVIIISLLSYKLSRYYFYSEVIHISSKPTGAFIFISKKEKGHTPLQTKIRNGEIIELIKENYRTGSYQLQYLDDQWKIISTERIDGIINDGIFSELKSEFKNELEIILIPDSLSIINFENLGSKEAELMIQGYPAIFKSEEVILAIDPKTYRYILKNDAGVFDNLFSVIKDTIIDMSVPDDSWNEGRFSP